eukprot:423811_1
MFSCLIFTSLLIVSNAYNDLCIRGSGTDELDQRYIFDLNSKEPYGEFNLVWKGVKQTQYWFWLALYNNSFEWTIDNKADQVLRYCTLSQKQQDEIKKGKISFVYPYSCANWNGHDPITKKSEPLEHMEVFDCDIYSLDELLDYIVFSTGQSAKLNDDGKIVIDNDSNANAGKSDKTGWDLRYMDVIYIMILAIMAYFLFKKEQSEKTRRLYRAVNTDNDEM